MNKNDLVIRIEEFKPLVDADRNYCEQLYKHATIRLLAHKYAYYVLSAHYVEDAGYDIEEQSWYVMGRALGYLKEDEITPCVGWDENHPLAKEALELVKKLKVRSN